MGMQLIGQLQGELALLSLGLAYEEAVGDWLSIKPSSQKLN
jgi:Asp-tRNA(Asn)/Glu-tRNA(Gln) amidotransferase A subunit family amidase